MGYIPDPVALNDYFFGFHVSVSTYHTFMITFGSDSCQGLLTMTALDEISRGPSTMIRIDLIFIVMGTFLSLENQYAGIFIDDIVMGTLPASNQHASKCLYMSLSLPSLFFFLSS